MTNKHVILIKNVNTILYCNKWKETVHFYQHVLNLPITFFSSWFVEFKLAGSAHLSIADKKKTTRKSTGEDGITLALQVENLDKLWQYFQKNGFNPSPVQKHPWSARVFYISDPEGHRIEAWSSSE
ncbi:Glyoxalase-like domain-containing protein [Desulfonema limicola]|uniref:Glyoxalase-like domain-containing protein n=1 Tax=Desulfonema limicola TaxID=45656 RepID=A0A975GHI2_9BACT|nr:VOC family protein [Desulfonema limicola]QTA81495.1 Glyoxalase-like domain-containing protein [Desulfonema limicola]